MVTVFSKVSEVKTGDGRLRLRKINVALSLKSLELLYSRRIKRLIISKYRDVVRSSNKKIKRATRCSYPLLIYHKKEWWALLEKKGTV